MLFSNGAIDESKRIYCCYLGNSLTNVNYRQVRDAVLNPDFNVCMGIIL